MKLWWPHSEAMIALLMGYSDNGDPALLHLFYQVAEYTFRQVSAASWATALYGLSKGVEETQAGFPGLWEKAGQGWGGPSHTPYILLHWVWSLSWPESSWRSPGALCSVHRAIPAPVKLMFR